MDRMTERLIGNTDAMVWAEEFCTMMTRLSPAERATFVTDQGTMVGWFANAIMNGYDEGVRKEQQRDIGEKLREMMFQAGGAATRPLLEDHPNYVFPSERVSEAVEYVCESFGIPREPARTHGKKLVPPSEAEEN